MHSKRADFRLSETVKVTNYSYCYSRWLMKLILLLLGSKFPKRELLIKITMRGAGDLAQCLASTGPSSIPSTPKKDYSEIYYPGSAPAPFLGHPGRGRQVTAGGHGPAVAKGWQPGSTALSSRARQTCGQQGHQAGTRPGSRKLNVSPPPIRP